MEVGIISVDHDGLGRNYFVLSGPDADKFRTLANKLYLKAGTQLDDETAANLAVTVSVDDPTIGTSIEDSVNVTLQVTDVSERVPPTISFAQSLLSVTSKTLLSTDLLVGTITVEADGLGRNYISLSGKDAASFRAIGNKLYLRAGTQIDSAIASRLDVTVAVDDPMIAGGIEDSVDVTVPISID